jgi:hypothetical protein
MFFISWKYLLAAIAASMASKSSPEVRYEQHIYQLSQRFERHIIMQFCALSAKQGAII